MSHSKTPLRQIKRYGTKGDYNLVTVTGDTYDDATMSIIAGSETVTPLLAFAENKTKAETDNETGASGVYTLLVAIDDDFNGTVAPNSVIRLDSKDFNISNVQVHRVKSKITFVELTING
jgi:hypothetical protein